jgi:hypothetical protein
MGSGAPRISERMGCVDNPALLANDLDGFLNGESRWNELGEIQTDDVSTLLAVDFLTDDYAIGVPIKSLEGTVDFSMIGDRNLIEPGGNRGFNQFYRRHPPIR